MGMYWRFFEGLPLYQALVERASQHLCLEPMLIAGLVEIRDETYFHFRTAIIHLPLLRYIGFSLDAQCTSK